ncbi:MAG: hypothetical protein K0R18_588 [Bacillales bacterium]|jgi:archaellum biogenesis ATPase FlaH|nr:hypothetical protein [Bacillales bacterium]
MEFQYEFGKAIDTWNKISSSLESFQENPLSETDCRCKIIDPILTQVLGWDEKNIHREDKISAGYIDYLCKSSHNKIVVEAKSTKIVFKTRSSDKVQPVLSKNLKKTSETLFDAIEQGRSYAKEKDCKLFVVSNGMNISISKTFVSGEETYDTLLMFGKDCITNNINILCEILSPNRDGFDFFLNLINSNNQVRSLPQHRKTILKNMYDVDARKGENPLAQALIPILNRFFSDITFDLALLSDLYCDNSDLDHYGQEIKRFVKGRIPMLGLPIESVKQIENKEDKLGVFGQDIVMKMQMQKGISFGHVFVIFGNLGAGKSTFLNHFYNYILKSINKTKLVWVLIDFQSWYGTKDDIESFIIENIQEALYKQNINLYDFDILKEIYKEDILRKVNGPWKPYSGNAELIEQKIGDLLDEKLNDKVKHVEKLVMFVKESLDYEICIALDNLDQQQAEIQEEASFYILTKSKYFKILAILSLRDETYWAMKKKPPMNAYGNITPYQIVPPSLEMVLTKRIQYVVDSMGEKEVTFDSSPNDFRNKVIKMKYKDVFNLFINTVKAEHAQRLLQTLASGNLRFGLEIFRDIVTSGHSNLNSILSYNIEERRKKIIPHDKLIKSIGLSQQAFYDSSKSNLLNVFQNNLDDGFHSHFINLRILEILRDNSEVTYKTDISKGFMPIENLLSQLKVYCSHNGAIRKVLSPLLERHLIESDIGARKLGEDNYLEKIQCVRITPSGRYHLEEILSDHQYLELVLFDTMIQDEKTFDKLDFNDKQLQKLQKRNDFDKIWEIRFQSIEMFLNYLKIKEEEDFVYLRKANINHFGKIMPKVIDDYRLKKKEIVEKLTQKKKQVEKVGM